MKAREDDRRLFSNPPKLNIIALQDSQPERLDAFSQDLANTGIAQADLKELLDLFEHSSTFGSLIQIPAAFANKLPDLETKLNTAVESGDIFSQQSAQELLPLVKQAKLLAKQYDAVIANPPYMGGKGMNTALKDFAKKTFPDSKSDMFAMFIERCQALSKISGETAFVTPYVWMFISSYEQMRRKLVTDATIQSLIQLEYNAFEPACIPVCAYTISKAHVKDYVGSYIKLSDFKGHENQAPKTLEAINNPNCGWFFNSKSDDFKKIPGSPVAYWVNKKLFDVFEKGELVGEKAKKGFTSGDNEKFIRYWWEIDVYKFSILNGTKWYPTQKGGEFRRWYGNYDSVVNWENNGSEIKNFKFDNGKLRSVIRNERFYGLSGVTWTDVSSGLLSMRYVPKGFIFNASGPTIFSDNSLRVLSSMNSKLISKYAEFLSPTLHFEVGQIQNYPIFQVTQDIEDNTKNLVEISQLDWDSYETSWDFTKNPIIRTQQPNLEQAFNTWQQQNSAAVAEMKRLEEENNKLFIDAYGLQDELTPDVPDAQITLTRADREKDSQRLVSYALGCMMGRYSLDESGLIYAHAGNQDFDASRYQTFPADADGIIPLTEMHWFEDDATHRIQEFLTAVWGKDTLDANMLWLAESLGKKASETAEDTIRRYLASKFYKDHMQTYKKRPIYWLFSSGKQGAFQALVYLHRYNESTLARMRTEYVMPLISKMAAMVNSLQSEIENSDSAAEIKRKEKELQNLHKQQAELSSFEEKLRHYADQRISLDLDDGVKVNYGKFGDLLAEVKAVTGEK